MYFKENGNINTEKTVELAIKTAKERNINYIIVATTKGQTAKLFKDANNINVACVTHAYGYGEAGKNELTIDTRQELKSMGFEILSTTHVLSGAERGLSSKFGGVNPIEIMANTLRMFGQGTKVCVEIAVMALDAGLIPYGEKIIAVGGSGRGADTAIIVTPAHANKILDTRINEIICKPM